MKLYRLFIFLLLAIATPGFSENFVLENKTSFPNNNQNTKIAIQWATTAKEVNEANHAIMYGLQLNPDTIHVLTVPGKVSLKIPEKAEYFRVLAWSKNEAEPDLHTNWVDIVPNKTYILEPDHLVPSVLMAGFGC